MTPDNLPKVWIFIFINASFYNLLILQHLKNIPTHFIFDLWFIIPIPTCDFLYNVNFYNLLSVYKLEKHQHIFNPSSKSIQKSKELKNGRLLGIYLFVKREDL